MSTRYSDARARVRPSRLVLTAVLTNAARRHTTRRHLARLSTVFAHVSGIVRQRTTPAWRAQLSLENWRACADCGNPTEWTWTDGLVRPATPTRTGSTPLQTSPYESPLTPNQRLLQDDPGATSDVLDNSYGVQSISEATAEGPRREERGWNVLLNLFLVRKHIVQRVADLSSCVWLAEQFLGWHIVYIYPTRLGNSLPSRIHTR